MSIDIQVRDVSVPAYSSTPKFEQELPSYILSPLALLHPKGAVCAAMMMGANCPPLLRPQTPLHLSTTHEFDQEITSASNCSLGIIAPTAAELAQSGWLQQAIDRQAARLERDGLIYLLLPPQWRRRVIRQLHHVGLQVDRAYLHLPHVQSSRYLVPLWKPAADYAFAKLIAIEQWKRTLVASALKLPGYRALFLNWFPSMAIIARKPHAAPLFNWLTVAGADAVAQAPADEIILTLSWRSQTGAVTIHGFSAHDNAGAGNGQLVWVAKTALSQSDDERRLMEESHMSQLGPSARAAGAQVSQTVGKAVVGGRSVLLQSALAGVPLVNKLKGRPRALPMVVGKLATWLMQWNQLTVQPRPFGNAELEEMVLAPAEFLSPLLNDPTYWGWLKAQVREISGTPLPRVAAHHDLTMWNVLLNQDGQLGVVDWEEASATALPFTDFLYAVTDAAAAVDGYSDRVAALRACFTKTGSYYTTVAPWRSRLQSALGLSDEVFLLCSHACWLRHAANEDHTAQPGDSRPFFSMLQWWIEHSIQGK